MKTSRSVIQLVVAFFLVKILLSFFIPLGNDEVYYWTYALYPDWSHFDHPPMVGWMIQFFTFDLALDHEIFLRLGSIITGAIGTVLAYKIGKTVKDNTTGWIAAAFYNASIYTGLIAGFMVMPDSPLALFWLMSVYYLMKAFANDPNSKRARKYILYFGVSAGLAMVSKYHGLFLWVGVIVYILFFARQWLKSVSLYISLIASTLITSPVLLWNIENNFISFGFQGNRIAGSEEGVQVMYLFQEIFGEFIYINPVLFVISIISLVAFLRKRRFIDLRYGRLLISLSVPLIATVLFTSLFQRTMPHWAGPAYISLFILAAAYIRSRMLDERKIYPPTVWLSNGVLVLVLIVGTLGINFYPGVLSSRVTGSKLGSGDVTLDMYGWDQIETGFLEILAKSGKDPEDITLISNRWYPGAHLDYYVAKPNDIKLLVLGEMNDIHKYYWINQQRGMITEGESAYMIIPSNNFTNPRVRYKDNFDSIELLGEFDVIRSSEVVKKVQVYRLNGYTTID